MKTLIRFVAVLALIVSATGWAADHLDSPLVQNDPAADINDVYAFINPNDPGELILVATVVPLASKETRFSPAVEYRFAIQNLTSGTERAIICRAAGSQGRLVFCKLSDGGAVIGPTERVLSNRRAGLRMFAGLRDDPFYFDLAAFQDTVDTVSPQFTNPGTDFFDGLNTLAFVIGIDTGLLDDGDPGSVLAVYASTHRSGFNPFLTLLGSDPATDSQVDRMGRPAINTALIDLLGTSPGLTDAYNTAQNPATWPSFEAEIAANLEALDSLDGNFGNTILYEPPYSLDYVTVAGLLADDRLLIDLGEPSCDLYLAVELGLPGCGGRTLMRDVIDDTLGAVVAPGVSDFVDDTNTYPQPFVFPFVPSP